jgi:hypothetical protein
VIGPRGTYQPIKDATCQLPDSSTSSATSALPYCHVICHVTATRPCHVTSVALPRQLPRHFRTIHVISRATYELLTSSRATCHPSSGDTCHLGIGPTVRPKCQNCLTRVTLWCCHVSCTDLPRHRTDLPRVSPGPATSPVRTCHGPVTCRTDLTRVLYGLYGQVQSASQNFACLARRTECDIFFIRTPFAIKIIPPESGRRAGRHGVGFVGFRALSFLSIFHALTGS